LVIGHANTVVVFMRIAYTHNISTFMEYSMPARIAAGRQRTNITLPEALLREARALDINLSQACEHGLAAAVAERRAEAWQRENRPAIAAWNEHVEQNGLPLADFRAF
jgi:antitoxin CcdA